MPQLETAWRSVFEPHGWDGWQQTALLALDRGHMRSSCLCTLCHTLHHTPQSAWHGAYDVTPTAY